MDFSGVSLVDSRASPILYPASIAAASPAVRADISAAANTGHQKDTPVAPVLAVRTRSYTVESLGFRT